ncbi:MAG: divalent-cation tolerance protein CutA [Proteobacteria bacterium]|nr:divalent-cation tolerance protein CutA [Pseudomonadota bacterium]
MFVVLCNCPPQESNALARALVEEGLAACVNVIGGVTSFYVWDGELQKDTEDTLLIKVAATQIQALGDRIRQLHSYSTVEIVCLPVDVDRSDSDYVKWVRHHQQ